MTDTPISKSAEDPTPGQGTFLDGFWPSVLATVILPSLALIVTISIVALTTAKVGDNPPELLFQLELAAIVLAIGVPNGLIGFLILRRHQYASLPGFFIGLLLGLVVFVPVGFVTWLLTMTVFYGAGM